MRIQDIKAVQPKWFKQMYVKDWYMYNYPDDELGRDINPYLKFYDLRIVLDNHYDIYFHLGVEDSIIRERVFSRLAELLNVNYDVIFNKWIEEVA
jgi:hypothetical protein